MCRAVSDYLKRGGATNDEIDDFLDFCGNFADTGKVGRYKAYRLWARLLRHSRTPFKKHGHFDFNECLKTYLRSVSKGEIVDADPPNDAIVIEAEHFVKFVVRHLDEAF